MQSVEVSDFGESNSLARYLVVVKGQSYRGGSDQDQEAGLQQRTLLENVATFSHSDFVFLCFLDRIQTNVVHILNNSLVC